MPRQSSYIIEGVTTFKGSATAGLKVWLWDMTKGKQAFTLQNTDFVYTNSAGEYNINLANVSISQNFTYENGDRIRVSVTAPDKNIFTWTDIIINVQEGYTTVSDIALTDKSGLVDGIKGEPNPPVVEGRTGR